MTAVPHPTSPRADNDLVAAVARGDLGALGELFERHEPGLRRYLGRLCLSASDADDLIQATFLEVMRASARFDPDGNTRSWLYGIATMMARRHRRSLGRLATRMAAWAGLARAAARSATPAEVHEGDEAMRAVRAAFAGLSAKKREVFVLVALEGLSGEEAARALGVPVNTVWTRLHHARRALAAALEGSDP
jgi:RNA polymerase sigma factor (sigma-70 family)